MAADPVEVAEVLWAAAHGVVSLELAGHFDEGADARHRYDTAVTAATSWFCATSRPD